MRGATIVSLVPTQLFDLMSYEAPQSLRAVIVGGGRLDPELYSRARKLGWPVHASYGMTECSSQIATALTADDSRLKPLSHVELRIDADEHIEIRSPSLLTGKIATDGKLVDPKQDGWLRTEDRGRIEADGSLSVCGRAADFVKIGGEGVQLPQLETRLAAVVANLKFAGDIALLAAHDERLGARVVLLSERPAEELAAEFNREVLPFERIRAVHVVEKLPRSALGKLMRAQALALVGLELPTNH